MFTLQPELTWSLFARTGLAGYVDVGEHHLVAASSGAGEIVRVRVTYSPGRGDFASWGGDILAPERLTRLSEFQAHPADKVSNVAGFRTREYRRYRVTQWQAPAGAVGKLPGDQVNGSLRWTIHPDALSLDRSTRLTAAWQRFATAETLWLLAGAPDSYIRGMVRCNDACPPDLTSILHRHDHFRSSRSKLVEDEFKAQREATDDVHALINMGEYARAARQPAAPPDFLDWCAREGDEALTSLAAVHLFTPIGAIAAAVRADYPRVRKVLEKRFALVELNPRWVGFSRAAIVAAVEHNLDDEVADMLVDLTDEEIADNFGRWGPPVARPSLAEPNGESL